jgi:hypothetical protein
VLSTVHRTRTTPGPVDLSVLLAAAIAALPPRPPGDRTGGFPRMAMLGASGSGKTTFLVVAALRMFTTDRGDRLDLDLPGIVLDDLAISPGSQEARAFMRHAGAVLLERRRFPSGTIKAGDVRLHVEARCTARRRRRWWARRPAWRIAFDLEAHDRLGGDYTDFATQPAVVADAVRNVADAQSIVFLLDLSSPRATADSARCLAEFIPLLRAGTPGGKAERLPHFVAVCVSKCDLPSVRDRVVGPHGRKSADVADNLRTLADDDRDIREALDILGTWFRPERVRCFATTSLGWAHDGDPSVVRSRVEPVNVWEPMVWLASSVGAFAGETA